ncbi:hypothetical protein [Actimicrobium sp. CCI2.3]|uniref:hypothetical protein n=1 Tax=Actimicrobium sp. CCI2.3 TaxID=3048616 RepID=UPI002AB50793|nr:hypothetical protein [Actimicrobium sp. CCI2.3]MDY7574649.1 hypothetical protein [Actimicrobium sp. CCI2.3]MEB0020394.1 hypothetical protein [Actimicrobium sp. CCI2.3]
MFNKVNHSSRPATPLLPNLPDSRTPPTPPRLAATATPKAYSFPPINKLRRTQSFDNGQRFFKQARFSSNISIEAVNGNDRNLNKTNNPSNSISSKITMSDEIFNSIPSKESRDFTLNHIESFIRQIIKEQKEIKLDYHGISESLKELPYTISCIKKPRWEDDALIIRVQNPDKKDEDYSVKLHEDKYPLASHIYDNKDLLLKISNSGFAAKVRKTFIESGESYQFRSVIYDYVDGKPMGSLVKNGKDEDLIKLRKSLKECVSGLLQKGVNVFVRDLDDFMVSSKDGVLKSVITDYNAVMDCSSANSYSRTRINDIIFPVIDKVVTKDYKPFVSTRPTLTDINNDTEKKDNVLDMRF